MLSRSHVPNGLAHNIRNLNSLPKWPVIPHFEIRYTKTHAPNNIIAIPSKYKVLV